MLSIDNLPRDDNHHWSSFLPPPWRNSGRYTLYLPSWCWFSIVSHAFNFRRLGFGRWHGDIFDRAIGAWSPYPYHKHQHVFLLERFSSIQWRSLGSHDRVLSLEIVSFRSIFLLESMIKKRGFKDSFCVSKETSLKNETKVSRIVFLSLRQPR